MHECVQNDDHPDTVLLFFRANTASLPIKATKKVGTCISSIYTFVGCACVLITRSSPYEASLSRTPLNQSHAVGIAYAALTQTNQSNLIVHKARASYYTVTRSSLAGRVFSPP